MLDRPGVFSFLQTSSLNSQILSAAFKQNLIMYFCLIKPICDKKNIEKSL